MGGTTFAPTLHCPRMPPPQYAAVKAHFATRLRALFHHVAVGREAPEKRDYGDVDYVVSRPKGSVRTGACVLDVKDRVERALGAVRGRVVEGMLFLACPMPGVAWCGGGGGGAKKKGEEEKKEDFVQLDIILCPSPSLLEYVLFTRSHGDLFGFLKTGVRPFGLSLRPSGLWVRVAEQQDGGGKLLANGCGSAEANGGNEGLLFLSSDVDAILQFLCLDKRKWDQGFERLQDVFEYAVSARWFSKRDFGGQNVRVVTEDGKGKLAQPQIRRANHSFEAYKATRRDVWNVFTAFVARHDLPNDPFTTSPSPDKANGAGTTAPSPTLSVRSASSHVSNVSSSATLVDDSAATQCNGHKGAECDVEAKATRAAVLAAALAHFPGAESRYHVHLATCAAARRETAFWARVKRELPGLVAASTTECHADEKTKQAGAQNSNVSAQRIRRVVLALRRYTEFARAVDMRDLGADETAAVRVPRLRRAGRPELDEEAFCSWTASSPNLTDDDLLAYVADNWAVAYDLDRSRTRPRRVVRRDEAARRRAGRRKGGAVGGAAA
ncbi:uncharacterized protein J3D65DRAFT_677235 [Phyllosticta citribraziliensis]|uniref:Uncharacterized protein n=1 Tax=Phyllosticta citribraziliensis TaxID=989973 RepID=A0ABR1LR47_9PEZI